VGVIHAAGVLDVRLIQQLDWDTMVRVLRPKVMGGWLLHKLLPEVELFVNFSSINALLGMPGQGNYAAANAFLDSLAAYRQAQGRHTLSINWGVWEGMGYAATPVGAESSVQLAAQGIGSFSANEGAQVFGSVLNWNQPGLVVVPADWNQYQSERSESRQFPMLKGLLEAGHTKRRAVAATLVVEALWAVEAKNRLNALGDHLQGLVSQILRVPVTRIKRDEPLGSYGINSLMGMELRNRLERDLGLTLSATLVWNYPTIESMSVFLAEKLGLATQASTETPIQRNSQPADAPALDTIIAGVDMLSDDDILKELLGNS
jgi:myxalamid-type polyketide synthase MxaE and MxaD